MVLADQDSNAILVAPLKSQAERELLRSTEELYKHLTDRGLKPQIHMLDNECSQALKNFIRGAHVRHQLVPPSLYRALVAKRAIQTYKAHLIAGLSSCDPNFPLHIWD